MGKNRESIIDAADDIIDKWRENIVQSIAAHGHKF